jgi:hypothetical protein
MIYVTYLLSLVNLYKLLINLKFQLDAVHTLFFYSTVYFTRL